VGGSANAATKAVTLVNAPSSNSSVSPDGRWIAYHSGQFPERNEVYVEPLPPTGEKHQITTKGGVNPLWSPDGKELFFETIGPSSQILDVGVDTTKGLRFVNPRPLPIEGVVNSGARPYDVTPDGKRFVVMVPKAQATPGAPNEQINVTLNWFTELQQRVPTR
jgi:dipeptidyl aminopeptidase/acylaminoacyl peptidase